MLTAAITISGATKNSRVTASAGPVISQPDEMRPAVMLIVHTLTARRRAYFCRKLVQTSCIFASSAASGAG